MSRGLGDVYKRQVCPPERVLEGGTALACAQTKQFCCFIGDEGTVEKHLRELEILAEKEKRQEGETFADSVIMYEVLSELKEIAARPGGITCACGSSRYGMEIRRSAVEHSIPCLTSLDTATALIRCLEGDLRIDKCEMVDINSI